ncbi:zinc ribbon domain-containing protein [Clostridium lundense]|uniref:zinc ribbon domain-containing protein n=1 Tax=Clostridium lundense TaxID=319475 RepID=UPI000486BD06|nr:C4-type zinc ribbon domain-containing protein [Clostridium lundense]
MDDIKLLLFLQEKYNKVEENNKILKDNSYIKILSKMKEDFNKLKKEYINGKSELENIRKKYKVLNEEIEELRKGVDEDEYILYNKCGNDLKMINTLQEEIESKNKKINEKEKEVMSMLEKEEKLSKEVSTAENILKKIKHEFNSYKGSVENKLHAAKEELKTYEKEMSSIRSKLPSDILEDFDYIKSQKKVAVALLQNGVCAGCKIKVSSLTIDELNKKSGIVHCDNCGRILWKED